MIKSDIYLALDPAYKDLCSMLAGAAMLFLSGTATGVETVSGSAASLHANDTHYTKVGFFDIHVCNWPDRELFFMPLFSTTHQSEITDIRILYPDGKLLTSLNLKQFNLYKPEDGQVKHVFMKQIDVPENATDGWYTAIISLVDGTQLIAKDYVIIASQPRATEMNPPDGAEQIAVPEKLTWSGAENVYYQVFIRDLWNEGKLIYESELLREPELVIPAGLMKPAGLYTWQVHTRDVDEDILLGDFNNGSMSIVATFSTSADQ